VCLTCNPHVSCINWCVLPCICWWVSSFDLVVYLVGASRLVYVQLFSSKLNSGFYSRVHQTIFMSSANINTKYQWCGRSFAKKNTYLNAEFRNKLNYQQVLSVIEDKTKSTYMKLIITCWYSWQGWWEFGLYVLRRVGPFFLSPGQQKTEPGKQVIQLKKRKTESSVCLLPSRALWPDQPKYQGY
jgi:hypothetical protein